ncbi:hypothetical protein RR46_14165 [Papilio xuthus]|uniref:Uncharacterized protein n=1 Tax=Papilio xuthus TaxID=66420 RepID=A0A194PJN7_PAPXU|nr:hypothetical protein RR46_14165 [Papilio xuthus]
MRYCTLTLTTELPSWLGGVKEMLDSALVMIIPGACWSTLTVSAAVVRHEVLEAHEAPAHADPPDPALGAAAAAGPAGTEHAGWQQCADAGMLSPRRRRTKRSEHVEALVLFRFMNANAWGLNAALQLQYDYTSNGKVTLYLIT